MPALGEVRGSQGVMVCEEGEWGGDEIWEEGRRKGKPEGMMRKRALWNWVWLAGDCARGNWLEGVFL